MIKSHQSKFANLNLSNMIFYLTNKNLILKHTEDFRNLTTISMGCLLFFLSMLM